MPTFAASGRIYQLSTRGQVLTADDVMIAGFIIDGSTPKTVVVTVAGPSLGRFGVAHPLANPTLTLVRQFDGTVIKSNDNWSVQDNADDIAAIVAIGFQPNHALEPAIIATLAPGAYTAIVRGVGGGTGVGLVGVFEVDHPEAPFINLSTRAKVLIGDDVMIAGFIIDGSVPQTVVVNVAGPSLGKFFANPLQNPTLTLVRSSDLTNNTVVRPTGTNQNIGCGASVPCPNASLFVLSDNNAPKVGFDQECLVVTGNSLYDPTSWPAGGGAAFYFARRSTTSNTLRLEGNTGLTPQQNVVANNTVTNSNGSPFFDEGAPGMPTVVVASGTCGSFPP